MNAFARMQVSEGACDVGSKGKSETPRQRFCFVVNIVPEVSVLDEFRNNEDAAVGVWGAR